MINRDNDVGDECLPVSSNLENYELPDFATETRVWRTRSHELWLRASNDGDTRGMAAALGAAFRGLDQWREEIVREQEKQEAATKTEPSKGGACTPEYFDRLLREKRADDLKHGRVNCPICLFSTVLPSAIAERFPDVVAAKEKYENNRTGSDSNASN